MPPELLTMTDLSFLPQTLVLLRTLEEVAPDVRLRVLAVDAAAADLLRARTSGRVDVVEPRDLMARDAALAAARGGRSHREWCWTLAPAFCSARIEAAPPGHTIAWVDSDIAFYRSPAELEDALGEASALLVPHRYHRQYRNSAPPEWLDANYGSLNGGTVVLRNDATGRRVAREWRDRTLEWCRAEVEPGRYGNQRYLEPLAGLDGVRTATSAGIGLAPWNAGRYRLSGTARAPIADGTPVLFFHFQSLRLLRRGRFPRPALPANYMRAAGAGSAVARVSPWFRVGARERRLLWRPYVRRLLHEVRALGVVGSRWWGELPPVSADEVRDDWRIRRSLAPGRFRQLR